MAYDWINRDLELVAEDIIWLNDFCESSNCYYCKIHDICDMVCRDDFIHHKDFIKKYNKIFNIPDDGWQSETFINMGVEFASLRKNIDQMVYILKSYCPYRDCDECEAKQDCEALNDNLIKFKLIVDDRKKVLDK